MPCYFAIFTNGIRAKTVSDILSVQLVEDSIKFSSPYYKKMKTNFIFVKSDMDLKTATIAFKPKEITKPDNKNYIQYQKYDYEINGGFTASEKTKIQSNTTELEPFKTKALKSEELEMTEILNYDYNTV